MLNLFMTIMSLVGFYLRLTDTCSVKGCFLNKIYNMLLKSASRSHTSCILLWHLLMSDLMQNINTLQSCDECANSTCRWKRCYERKLWWWDYFVNNTTVCSGWSSPLSILIFSQQLRHKMLVGNGSTFQVDLWSEAARVSRLWPPDLCVVKKIK